MSLTDKQKRYARCVADGLSPHDAAIKAGCKSHDAARKYVTDMSKRQNVQDYIAKLIAIDTLMPTADSNTQNPLDGEAAIQPKKHESPLEYLTAVFNNACGLYSPKERISAAIALLPYTEQKLAATGKKEDQIDNAKIKSESGRFATLGNQMDIPWVETHQ